MTTEPWIECLAQTFAEQVDRDEQHAKAQAWCQADPRCLIDELAALRDHQAPFAGWGLRAEAQEGQRRTEQNGEGHAQAALDDDWRPRIGQDLTQQDGDSTFTSGMC